MSRLLTPEELAALLDQGPFVHAPVERLHVVVDAGFTDLTFEEVEALKPGDVIRLSHAAGDPVEIVANGVTVATGLLTDAGGRAAVRVVSLTRRATSPGRTPR
jgi:flagellar motor switch protein FliM